MDNNYLDVKKKVHMLLNLNFPGHEKCMSLYCILGV